MMSDFSVEQRPPSRWNTVRHQHGVVSAIAWNTHLLGSKYYDGSLFGSIKPSTEASGAISSTLGVHRFCVTFVTVGFRLKAAIRRSPDNDSWAYFGHSLYFAGARLAPWPVHMLSRLR